MVVFDALAAAINIDMGFFTGIAMGNLLWLAIFYALVHIFFDGKNVLYWFALFTFTLWSVLDFERFTGLAFSGAAFLLVYYISKISLIAFVETTPSLKKFALVFSTLHYYALALFFTFLVV